MGPISSCCCRRARQAPILLLLIYLGGCLLSEMQQGVVDAFPTPRSPQGRKRITRTDSTVACPAREKGCLVRGVMGAAAH